MIAAFTACYYIKKQTVSIIHKVYNHTYEKRILAREDVAIRATPKSKSAGPRKSILRY